MANIVTLPVSYSDGMVLTASALTQNFNALNTATIPVANGGTGLTTTATGSLLLGSSATAWGLLAIGAANRALVSDGSTAAWTALSHTTHLSNVGTNTHAQIDTHIAASANVHGLPASVNVLGNRNAAAEFIQHGAATTANTTETAGNVNSSDNDAAVTYPVAFGSAPRVFAQTTTGARSTGCVASITTTGFNLRGLGGSTVLNLSANWLAIGTA